MKFRFKTPGGGVGPNLKFHKKISAVTMAKLVASIVAAVEPEELPKKRLSRQAKLKAAVEAKKARAQKRRNRKLRKAEAKKSGGEFTDDDIAQENIGVVNGDNDVDDFMVAAAT
jgi:FKBP-type peptidyl-prolyl cis-trans isomerase